LASVTPFSRAEIPGSPERREQLAKEWVLRIVERTPAAELGALPLGRIIEQGPPLIADVLASIRDPLASAAPELDEARRERAVELAQLRPGPDAAEELPRDLAALQALLVETLRREIPERRPGDFAQAVERLAEAFGSIQGTVASTLVEERAGGAPLDPLTGLPGPLQLEEWLRISLAEHRRYGHPFAIALIDLDGLARINDAHGREAGDRMLTEVAALVRRHVREVDQAFRVGDDEFCVLAPHQRGDGLRPAAERIAELIAGAEVEDGPRLAVTIGIGSCPEDGETIGSVREAAEQAAYEAKAAGLRVNVSRNETPSLQDP
jgi:diguanylate cyclase (GGDEF)-like protein